MKTAARLAGRAARYARICARGSSGALADDVALTCGGQVLVPERQGHAYGNINPKPTMLQSATFRWNLCRVLPGSATSLPILPLSQDGQSEFRHRGNHDLHVDVDRCLHPCSAAACQEQINQAGLDFALSAMGAALKGVVARFHSLL